jgi:DNA-binding NtrC family response regulator
VQPLNNAAPYTGLVPGPRPQATTAAHVGRDGDLVLVIVSDAGTSVVPLVAGKDVVLGRADECEITIDDASVSRKHTAIGGVPLRVEDLGSRNGTRLFGERLEPGSPVPLPVGASLELGSVTVLVQRAGGPLAELLATGTSAKEQAPRDLPPSFIAVDPRTLRVVRLAELVAQRSIHLMILGEPGTGKETLARFVHERSARSSGPFEVVARGAALDDSEWDAAFGRAQGSQSAERGADRALGKGGAEGGTLYIDGLEALSDEAQAKLARRIEATPSEDIRVIGGAPAEQAASGVPALRVDLVRSLSSFTLRMPRLRDRIGDIKPLAEHFARAAAARAGRAVPEISRGALARLEAHAWPLGVADLARTIEGAVLAAERGCIDEEHVEVLGVGAPPADDATHGRLKRAVEELERRRVLDALAEAGGNQSLAAKKLGIARGTLIARLDAYGIARPRRDKGPT